MLLSALHRFGFWLCGFSETVQARLFDWGLRLALAGLSQEASEDALVNWLRGRGVKAYTIREIAALPIPEPVVKPVGVVQVNVKSGEEYVN